MNRGQIPIAQLFGWGLTIAITVAGTYFTQARATDEKIISVTATVEERNAAVLQRVAKLEEAIGTIKDNNKSMQADIKEVLRILK